MTIKALLAVAVVVSLAACAEREPPEEAPFDDMVETMDKARAVEDMVLDRKAELGKEIEKQQDDQR